MRVQTNIAGSTPSDLLENLLNSIELILIIKCCYIKAQNYQNEKYASLTRIIFMFLEKMNSWKLLCYWVIIWKVITYIPRLSILVINQKDLLKKERRRPKGSAAQLRVKRNEDNNQAWLEDVPRRLRSLNPDQIEVLQNIINQVQTE